jgi:hypothetical protein
MTPPPQQPLVQEKLDFSFVLLTQLGRVLSTPVTRGGERYNRLLELAALLHPYKDEKYRAFAAEYFAKKPDERIARTLVWLEALVSLASRAGFLGVKDARQ